MKLILCLLVLILFGCDKIDVQLNKPSNEEAKLAINNIVPNANNSSLPFNLSLIDKVEVTNCIPATPQNGYFCECVLVSKDIPVIGGVAINYSFRFSKTNDKWSAYLN